MFAQYVMLFLQFSLSWLPVCKKTVLACCWTNSIFLCQCSVYVYWSYLYRTIAKYIDAMYTENICLLYWCYVQWLATPGYIGGCCRHGRLFGERPSLLHIAAECQSYCWRPCGTIPGHFDTMGLLKSDFWPHFCEYLWKLFQVQSTWGKLSL